MLQSNREGGAAGEATPRSAQSSAQPAQPAQSSAPAADRPLVCIVSRGRIENVTRMPRLAKVLVEAGYGVVVVALAVPIPRLQQMCPEVEYIAVRPSPWTADVQKRWEARRQERLKSRANRGTAPAGGLAGRLSHGLRRVTSPLLQVLRRVGWRLLVAVSTLLLKKRQERFGDVWRTLAGQDLLRLGVRFVMARHQRAMTHAFAEEVEKATRGRRFAVVQAHDSYALVAAATLAARDGAKLIYDAVELSSHRLGAALNLSLVERFNERLQRREESRIARRADAWITVGDGLADWYAAHVASRRPLVVRNCRYYWRYRLDGRLRVDAGLGPEARIVLYTGSIHPQQGIELMIGALPHMAPHVHFAVVGFAQPSQKVFLEETLPALAASLGVAERVHFLPERDPLDLVPYISGADIGVIPRPSQHPNNFYSMPNKFLEMIMARLPIAVSQLGDMVTLVKRHQIGAVFDERNPLETAAVIGGMLERAAYVEMKRHVADAAELFNWEKESVPYVELVRSLTPAYPKKPARDASRARNRQAADASAAAAMSDVPRHRPDAATAADQAVSAAVDFDLRDINRQLETAGFDMSGYRRLWRSRAGQCKAEAYVAHGVEALLAADIIAETAGGRVYCDLAEIPGGGGSAFGSPDASCRTALDRAFAVRLRQAAGLLTSGWALKERIRHYGPPVHVIPDYRRVDQLSRSTEIRERIGLRPGDRLLLANGAGRGLAAIIAALPLLPDNVHLAVLGPTDDGLALPALARSVGVENRVHCFDALPCEELPRFASGADLGLIALDPLDPNDRVSLPGCLFDWIAAGLPIVTPDAASDVARIVEERSIGAAFPGSGAACWATAITAALAAADGLRGNLRTAAAELVWDSLADRLHAAIGDARSVALLCPADLVEGGRAWRMAETLVKRGAGVTICCRHTASGPASAPSGVRLVPFAVSLDAAQDPHGAMVSAAQ